MTTLIITPAGQPIPRAEKFAGESVIYTLDCTKIINPGALVVSATGVNTTTYSLSDIRTRKGKSIEVRVTNPPLDTEAYIDITIPISFTTSDRDTRIATFSVRVYK